MITIVPFLDRVNQAILNPIITLIFAVSTVYFIYGVLLLIGSDGKSRDQGKKAVTWGLVGIFVMFSVYGILNILLKTFSIQNPTYINSKL
jgi:hypothetical protein